MFTPGTPKPPGAGRKKGTPNKATGDVRAVFAEFVNANAGKLQELWDKVADKDPAKAIELFGRLAEYVVPKQRHTEVTGENGGPVIIEFPPIPAAEGP